MPLKISKFTGAGSTPSRRRFWDSIVESVESERKLPGNNVVVTEFDGMASVIDVNPQRANNQGGGSIGACCYNDGTCDDLTESDCTDAGGNWQGPDTTCADDPPPCAGVCCEASGCVDDSTPDSCAADGGTWTDFGTTCADDPPPCEGACCASDGTCSITTESDCIGTYQGNGTLCDPNPCCDATGSILLTDIYSGFFFEEQDGVRLGVNYKTLVGRMYWDSSSHIGIGGNCFIDSHMTGDVSITSDFISGYSGSGTATQSVIPSGSDCGGGSCGNGSETCTGGAASFSLYTSGNTNNGVVRCDPCDLDIYFNRFSSPGTVITNTATRLVTEYPPNSVTLPNTASGTLTIDWTWSNAC